MLKFTLLILIVAIWWLAMGAIGTIITWTNPEFRELYFEQMDDTVDKVIERIQIQYDYPMSNDEARKYGEFGYKYIAPIITTGRGPLELFNAIRTFVL